MRFAEGPEDLPQPGFQHAMSGLEMLRAIRDGRLPHPAMAATANLRLVVVEDGEVVFRGVPEFRHTNPTGGVHGGWYGTILDSALGCAAQTKVPRGAHYTTLEYRVNLTRAVPPGREVEARAWVQHAGRSTVVAAAELRGVADGKLYATGSTTCLILQG